MRVFGPVCAAFAVLTSVALSPALASPAKVATPSGPLVLEDFFRGKLMAEGTFTNTVTGAVRGLKVAMHGTWDGKTLTLVEDFAYSDGERDRKTWRFERLGEGRYKGTREDVARPADVNREGEGLRFGYTARVTPPGGGVYDLAFNDLLVKTGPRTVLNTADVKLLFFTVGRVELTIRKVRG
jgi:hypothetical protein